MRDVTFCTDSFGDPRTVAHSERTLACLLWALVFANESFLMHGKAPALYRSGVRWQREEPTGRSACEGGEGQELFLGARQVMKQGHADCEDLASWRVAEVRLGKVSPFRAVGPRQPTPPITACPVPYAARPVGPAVIPGFYSRVINERPRVVLYHIVVIWPDGYVEDPSRHCGMGGAG